MNLSEIILEKARSNKYYLIMLGIYTFFFLFFCSKMSPLYPINEWADINVYFNVGKGMLNGMTLYSEIFDHKGPLIFFIYGLGSLISGSSYLGMFILQVIAWIVAVYAVYFTARFFVKDFSAFIISLITPLSFLAYMYNGGSAEEMVLLFEVISLYFFVAYYKQTDISHKPYYMFVHGVLTSMTFLIKLNLMLFWFFPLLYIFIYLLSKKGYKNFLQNCLAYLAGFALVVIPTCLYLVYHGALGEAYHVYIELNRQYASTDNYSYLITNGISKIYKAYRIEFVWFLIITIGVFLFPIIFFKGSLRRISFVLSGISLFVIIFFSLTYHFYYPLPVFAFVVPGLIYLGVFFEKYVTVSVSKKLIVFSALLILLIGVNKRNFFSLGADSLLRNRYPDGPQFVFKDEILKEKKPTLLNLGFGEGNALFVTTNITPDVKYFFCPNIYYDMYPDIRDNQAEYIREKKPMFVLDCNTGFNYDFFKEFEPFRQNYTLVDSTVMRNDYVIDRFKTFYLYKRND